MLKAESSKKLKKQQETATRQKETGKAAQKQHRYRKKYYSTRPIEGVYCNLRKSHSKALTRAIFAVLLGFLR